MQPLRNTRVDIAKGLFVVAMIVAHVDGVWEVGIPYLSIIVNLAAFSGFMFCFGFTTQIAYFSSPTLNFRRIFPSIYRPLLAFYVSGIFIAIVEAGRPLNIGEYVSILTLSTLPTYAEFLPAFSLVILAAFLLMRPLNWILDSPVRFGIVSLALLLTTFFPNDGVQSTQIALLVGAPRTVTTAFPVLQYSIFFLLGRYYARYRVSAPVSLALTIAAGVIFILRYGLGIHSQDERFPPSLGWILGGIPGVLLTYWLARLLDKIAPVRAVLASIGENTLLYLVISNLMMFGLRASLQSNVTPTQAAPLTIFILAAIFFLVSIVRKVKPSLPPANNPAQG